MSTAAPATDIGPAPDTSPLGVLDTILLLRTASPALVDQLGMYAQLVRIEWAEEKRRLLQMWFTALVGFACLLCGLLFTCALVLAFTWDTAWRVPSTLLLVGAYLTGLGLAWWRWQALAARGDQAFAATREELAADVELLRSKL